MSKAFAISKFSHRGHRLFKSHKANKPFLQTVQGVKGLLEQAGYTVYNPTLPYHNPMQAWNPTDGIVAVQTYVDVFKKVGAFADIRAGENDKGLRIADNTRKVPPDTLCMLADHNTSTRMSVIT